jgi:alanine racemase
MKIGIIAMGYGDGYPRTAKNLTPVIVNGQRCGIVGRVSMDMISIDLSNCLNAQIGDKVELWGHDLPLEEVASYTSNISFDMITNIQYRVKFEWQDF